MKVHEANQFDLVAPTHHDLSKLFFPLRKRHYTKTFDGDPGNEGLASKQAFTTAGAHVCIPVVGCNIYDGICFEATLGLVKTLLSVFKAERSVLSALKSYKGRTLLSPWHILSRAVI